MGFSYPIRIRTRLLTRDMPRVGSIFFNIQKKNLGIANIFLVN